MDISAVIGNRQSGFHFFLLGAVVFLVVGFALVAISPESAIDFQPEFYSARCILQNLDPYDETAVMRMYVEDQANRNNLAFRPNRDATRAVYLPSLFLLTVPLAFLPFHIARWIWIGLSASTLLVASRLVWNVARESSSGLSGILLGFFLSNSFVILFLGNPAGVAVGLCIIATWCLIEKRHRTLGILCLAVSLMMKPHDTGLVWLYFFLVEGTSRKDATRALALCLALSIPFVIWVSFISPGWPHELHSNLLRISSHGDTNDPGPASRGARSLGMMVNLQVVLSALRDDPSFYNLSSYCICGAIFVVWLYWTIGSRPLAHHSWLALAAIATLSLLPIYHRQSDAKLLLLTVPACTRIWEARHKFLDRLALFSILSGLAFTGDLWWLSFFTLFISRFRLFNTGLSKLTLTGVQDFPAPLSLLVLSTLLTLVYVREIRQSQQVRVMSKQDHLPT